MTTEKKNGRRPAGNCMTHGENLPCYECAVNAEIERVVAHGKANPGSWQGGICVDCKTCPCVCGLEGR